MSFNRKQFLKDRKKAFTAAIMEDDWEGFKKYCKKYGIPVPREENIMKAGCYKGVQYCTDMPEEVKQEAMMKCLKIGFSPFVKGVLPS